MSLSWDMISAISSAITATGLILIIWQVRADHEKSRREYSGRLIWDWTVNSTRNTRVATKLVDRLSEFQCEQIYHQRAFKMSIDDLSLLDAAISDTSLTYNTSGNEIEISVAISSHLRSQTTRYLNLLESVFVAWWHKVGNQRILEEQFKSLVIKKGGALYLHNYLIATGGTENYPMIFKYFNYIITQNGTNPPKNAGAPLV